MTDNIVTSLVATGPVHGLRASELLDRFLSSHREDRIALSDLVAALGDRAFGALLLVFALLNLIPVPLPGLSTVLGIPMVLLAAQLTLGRHKVWLPARLAAVTMPRDSFARMIGRAERHLQRIEKLLRPRWTRLTEGMAERGIGTVCLVLALVLSLPIPFGNLLPAFAIALMALGLLEEDGICVLAGLVVAAISLTVVAGVIGMAVQAGLALVERIF
jgi:hypothetical protein